MSSNGYGAKKAMNKPFAKIAARLAHLTQLSVVLAMSLPHLSHADTPVTLLALGDSLTAGYGLDQGDGFVPQLQTWLHTHGRNVTVINAGVSGDTTAGGRARLGWSLTDEVDLVLVNLGGNDMLRGLPATETRRNLDAILTEINTRNLPSVLIRVPASLNFGTAEKAAYDQAFADLASKHGSTFIPNFFAALEAPGATQEDRQAALRDYMQPDGLHPTRQGVKLIVDQIGPTILMALPAATDNSADRQQ
ncbi:arylesterase [Aliiroseovarius crassostreae]|uniref:arylesterase n=1 Tax=Aliiroseovarius crassostreae TaxID=154981 RepID=UPI00223C0041|nr:arylesterase [Aliiroseovarius crassostreae]